MLTRRDQLSIIPGRQHPLPRPAIEVYQHALDSLQWLAITLSDDLPACEAINQPIKLLEQRLELAQKRHLERVGKQRRLDGKRRRLADRRPQEQ